MNEQTKAGASNTGSKPKTLLIAGGESKAFDTFNNSEKAFDSQSAEAKI